HYLPDAVGSPVHLIEGIHDLSAEEAEFIGDLERMLNDPALVKLVPILAGIVSFDTNLDPLRLYLPWFEFDYQTALSAVKKLFMSHGFESIYYGVMHGPGWNVYHVPSNLGNGGAISP